MNDIINIDNNYYFKIIKSIDDNIINASYINKLKIYDIFKKKKLLFVIDFTSFKENEYKKLLKKILFIKSSMSKSKIKIGEQNEDKKLLGYVLNYDSNNEKQNDFISGINAIFYKTRYERYNYIYDTVCDYLDNFFYGKNLCDFKNNKCGEKRNTSSVTGCCHHFKHKALGPLSKLVLCEYLKEDYTCGAKCISCKLFTCDYLESKGIKFKINDILLLDTFFNTLQKYFIKYMVFTPKEKILKRLMKL